MGKLPAASQMEELLSKVEWRGFSVRLLCFRQPLTISWRRPEPGGSVRKKSPSSSTAKSSVAAGGGDGAAAAVQLGVVLKLYEGAAEAVIEPEWGRKLGLGREEGREQEGQALKLRIEWLARSRRRSEVSGQGQSEE